MNRKKTAVIGPASQNSFRTASTQSVPNFRNTPATIAITIGVGKAAITTRTQPVTPSSNISAPVAR